MATVKVLAFGMITDIIGKSELVIENVKATEELMLLLKKTYPKLLEIKFMVSLNKKMITTNHTLENNYEIALLPPFSGG